MKTDNKKMIDGWEITEYANPRLTSPILIEGMPGIGNVGKISMDILIDETKATLVRSFYSRNLPNSVFVNEDNLIDMPKISLYHKKISGQDFLFLTGDVQPVGEEPSYRFSELIIDIFKSYGGKHILTLGGIGLSTIPEDPKVYITGNDKKFVDETSKALKQKKLKFETKIYGMVGPIIGISGLLLGTAKRSGINAYCLLSETLGHPVYVGLKGARAILLMINTYYAMNIDLGKLDKEIKQIDMQAGMLMDQDKEGTKYRRYSDVNYIG